MIRILYFSLIMLLLPSFQAKAAETQFFESLYDIPVMGGLTEVTEMSLNFDKAEGRIAYAAAVSNHISENQILSFYAEVLPQMGWQGVTAKIFTREKEKLQISFEKTKTSKLVRFSLSPTL